jgi:hypothetical protein
MDPQPAPIPSVVDPPRPGRFRLGSLVLWLPGCAVLGCAVAWAAEVAEGYFAPFLLFPILVGVVLGGLVVAALRMGRVGHRTTILLGGLVAILMTVAGRHYLDYWTYRHELIGDSTSAALRRRAETLFDLPTTWPEYLRWKAHRGWSIGPYTIHDEAAWLMWGLDALVLAVPALVLIVTAARLPFCDRCRSWYHTMRAGRIDPETTALLAGLAGLKVPPEYFAGRYRLSGCAAGCNPAALELFWDEPDRDFSSERIWLDRLRRDEVLDLLERRALQISAGRRHRRLRRRRKKPRGDDPTETGKDE